MRKKLLATLPAGLLVMTLGGCGNNNAAFSEKVDAISQKYTMTRANGLPQALPSEQRVYTVSQTVGEVEIPGDQSHAAQRQDELNAMRAQIQAVHDDPAATPGQKAVLARMLAEIDLGNARYLSAVAQAAYDNTKSRATDLQPYANQVDALLSVISILRGDRESIIDTLETGEVGNGMEIDGLDQLRARAQAIRERLQAATEAYEDYQDKAQSAGENVERYDNLQLELQTDARTLSGQPQFDVLNQAVTAWLEARLAEIDSEYNELLASAEAQSKELNQRDLDMVEEVMTAIQGDISAIRADIQAFQGQVNEVEDDREEATDDLDGAYRVINDRMNELVFQRLTDAAASAESAASHYSGIVTTGQAQNVMKQEQLTALLTQLQIYHQHALQISGYKSSLDALQANGRDVLGRNLSDDLASRSAQLDEQLAALKAVAADVQTAAADLSAGLLQSAGAETDAAILLAEQGQRLEAIRTGLASLPYKLDEDEDSETDAG